MAGSVNLCTLIEQFGDEGKCREYLEACLLYTSLAQETQTLKLRWPFALMGAIDARSVNTSALIPFRFRKSSRALMDRVFPAFGAPLNSIMKGRLAVRFSSRFLSFVALDSNFCIRSNSGVFSVCLLYTSGWHRQLAATAEWVGVNIRLRGCGGRRG